MKIALTGPHGVGKTTLINALAPRLSAYGRISVCREAPRLIVDHVGDPEFFRRGNNQLSRQALIFIEHLMEERRATAGADVVFSDRTLVDHLAYTQVLFPEAVNTPEVCTYRRLAFESLSEYAAIFQLPIEFAPLDDGVRESDLEFQRQVGDAITALYAEAGVTTVIVKGEVAERAAQIEKYLAGLSSP